MVRRSGSGAAGCASDLARALGRFALAQAGFARALGRFALAQAGFVVGGLNQGPGAGRDIIAVEWIHRAAIRESTMLDLGFGAWRRQERFTNSLGSSSSLVR